MVDPVLDPETGLQYLRNRYYDPSTAQFLTEDPLQAITQQSYGYAGDDPLDQSDPSGLCFIFSCSTYHAVEGAAKTAIEYSPPGVLAQALAPAATWAYQHPVEAVGLVAGAVSLATGAGEVVAGGGAVAEGVLGAVSVASGLVAAGVDTHYCLAGSGIACVGAGVGLVATGGGAAVVLGVATGDAAAGATAIGLTLGGIGLLSDAAGTANAATSGGACGDGRT